MRFRNVRHLQETLSLVTPFLYIGVLFLRLALHGIHTNTVPRCVLLSPSYYKYSIYTSSMCSVNPSGVKEVEGVQDFDLFELRNSTYIVESGTEMLATPCR
jgi:hypothetical protein